MDYCIFSCPIFHRSDLAQSWNPDAGKNLEKRLAKSDLLSFKFFEHHEKDLKGIAELQTIEQSISRSMEGGKKGALEPILRKKEILISLLDETNQQLKEFKIDSAAAQKERDMIEKETAVLTEVLKRTTQVRNTLEKDNLRIQPINPMIDDETKGV